MKGSFHQSRRQSNFYNGMKPNQQERYAQQWVAAINNKLLEPFIKITGATKHNREVFYEIDIERLLKVEEENQRFREALEYYADTKHYEPYCIPMGDYASDVTEDNGEIARQALAGESK